MTQRSTAFRVLAGLAWTIIILLALSFMLSRCIPMLD